ncbi:helix-turn-helix transcriptional regulator [Nocardia fluminea]|uniref:helix-turn-helix transcriptional regulator n=1 Tax=Nocardia fluminea TaxID=134984 RepID=UPI00343E2281
MKNCVAEMLVRYRIRARISQEELADKAQLSVRAIRNIERGYTRYPHIASVRRLGVALDLSDDERTHLLRSVDRPFDIHRKI